MKKHKEFMAIIEVNRRVLRAAGFRDSTVSRWATGNRIPRPKVARKISIILRVPLESIPQRVETII